MEVDSASYTYGGRWQNPAIAAIVGDAALASRHLRLDDGRDRAVAVSTKAVAQLIRGDSAVARALDFPRPRRLAFESRLGDESC